MHSASDEGPPHNYGNLSISAIAPMPEDDCGYRESLCATAYNWTPNLHKIDASAHSAVSSIQSYVLNPGFWIHHTKNKGSIY